MCVYFLDRATFLLTIRRDWSGTRLWRRLRTGERSGFLVSRCACSAYTCDTCGEGCASSNMIVDVLWDEGAMLQHLNNFWHNRFIDAKFHLFSGYFGLIHGKQMKQTNMVDHWFLCFFPDVIHSFFTFSERVHSCSFKFDWVLGDFNRHPSYFIPCFLSFSLRSVPATSQTPRCFELNSAADRGGEAETIRGGGWIRWRWSRARMQGLVVWVMKITSLHFCWGS